MEDDPAHAADWKQWFQDHGPKLMLCARQWTRSFADAEDVVQEAEQGIAALDRALRRSARRSDRLPII